jgi:hypothetical protein
MKYLVIGLVIAVILIVVAGLAIVVVRGGLRGYQKYSGLEHQRGSAKQSREVGKARLKGAERNLVEAQRELASRGDYASAQSVERLRSKLSTLADRLRYATYGYSPIGSQNPVREAELADLQERDADTIGDAQRITDLALTVKDACTAGQTPDLQPLQLAVDQLADTLDRRRTTN